MVGWHSLTQWTGVETSSGGWWWTGKPGSPWGRKEPDMTVRLNKNSSAQVRSHLLPNSEAPLFCHPLGPWWEWCQGWSYGLPYLWAVYIYIYSLLDLDFCRVKMAFLAGSKVKDPPAMQKAQVWSLDQEDPLEEGMATHSSILAWRIPWIEPGGLQSTGLQRVRHDWSDWTQHRVKTFFHFLIPHTG